MRVTSYKILSPIITSIFFWLYLKRGFIDPNASLQLVIILSSVIIISSLLLIFYGNPMPQIVISLVALIFILFGSFYVELLGIFLAGLPFIITERRETILKSLFITMMFFFLMILSGALRIQEPSGLYVFSIYDDIPKQYVPLLFYNGIVISTGRLVVTVSLLSLLIMGAAAYFAVENTSLILKNYKITDLSSAMQIVPVIASCQCESSIGLSAFAVTIFSLLTLPLITISLIFLFITNQVLRGRIQLTKGLGNKLSRNFLIAMLVTLLASSILILLEIKLYILISTFLTGLILISIVRTINRKINFGLKVLTIGILLQLASFLVLLISMGNLNFEMLLLLTALSSASSIMLSLYMGGVKKYDSTIYELYFSMWTMMFLVLLLITQLLAYTLLGSILESALIILLISIPSMWISNLYNLRAFSLIRFENDTY